ncbi:SnoaL-like domain-containing protein [Rhizobium laguerreae]|uniref:nuclear transport factor 2 family protein n=1 Tax=Rhizobium laguerreae TaxID=1076926 RepID=UPI001C902B22|nr:nuclear transport factor 2 family protein [Rhizobium laguerreae]MBY3307583.1 SnoaL-like domain-containing protein [Rhizobium laguerreae]
MSTATHSAVAMEVEKLILEFLMGLDTGDFEAMTACMAPDGIWHRQDKILRGHAMILEALAARGSDVRTAHLITNFRLVSTDNVSAETQCYMVAYRHDGPVRADEPSPMNVPFSITLCRCRFVMLEEKWKIAEIQSQPRFRR